MGLNLLQTVAAGAALVVANCAEPNVIPYYGIQFDLESEDPRILDVIADGPAALAGLRANDSVVAIDGETFSDLAELRALIRGKSPGDEVTFRIRRGVDELDVKVIAGKPPDQR